MSSKILERISAQAGTPRLVPFLARELSLGDLQSLLLHVYQARAAEMKEPDLIRAASRGLLRPSQVSARLLNQFDRMAFETARDFEAVELSPAAPFGLNRVLGGIDQNNVLTTIRNAEILGDPTPAMALECALRRKNAGRHSLQEVRLCGSQRVVRLQPFDVPGYSPHFRLFALVSAGRDTGSHAFEIRHLGEHIRFYLELCRALHGIGFSFTAPLVEITDAAVVQALLHSAGVGLEELRESVRAHKPGGSEQFLASRGIRLPDAIEDPARELPGLTERHPLARVKTGIFDVLQRDFPEARFRFNLARLEGLGYYRGLCLRISPAAKDGTRYPIVDGGLTDWTARLLQDRKERLLATGIGTEFTCRRYHSGRHEG
ncbi:MAG TPA: hypothetical protein VEV17_26740 [Bryobacteraceae bacterium]|nr:hypothetical protein [Bryobacteraceae bacterium]